MNLFELFAVISLDSSGFMGGLKDASAAAQSIGGKIGSAIETAGKLATAAFGAATAAAVTFGADAVGVGKQFDASMANVASISGAAGQALTDLREKAIEMGGSTKFSATEAADAMGYMAMAGWKTEEMLDGISGIMNLAAASGTDLATTADIVTDALTAFGMGASDSGHFADILAVASSNANTNVQMMGETFKYVAPLAGTLGLTAEDVAEAIGLMANAGIKASQAGTALRSGLTRLTKPTDDMIGVMKRLGLAVSELSAEEAEAQTQALEQSLKDKQKAYESDYDALQESLEKQYDALEKSLKSRYDAQEEAYANECDARKTAQEKGYDALEKSLDAEVTALEKAHEQRLSEFEKEQEAEVSAQEKALERKLQLIDEEYTESLRLTNEAEYNRLKALDDQIAAIEAESEREQKAAEESERAQRRAELQKAVDAADGAEKRQEAERKLAEYNEKIRQKDAEAARKAQIADLKAQKDAAKEEAKAERDAAKEKRDARAQAEKEASAEELKQIKERQKNDLDQLKDGQKRELEQAKAANKEKLAERKAADERELKELKNAQSKQLANLKDSNSETLKETKRGYDRQLDALKESNKEKLSEYQDYVTEQKKAIKAASESAQSLVLTDEKGNMRSLNEAVGILREAFSGLSEAEQAEAASTLFGQEAMSGWLAMLNAAPGDIAKLESALQNAEGAAEKMAAVHEGSLAGSITTLGSAIETLKIRISDEITPALRKFTEFAQSSVVALTEAFEEGGFSGMMDALGPVIEGGLGMLMGYVPQVAEVGGQLLGAVVTGIVNNLPILADGALKLATEFGGYLLDAFRDVFSGWGLGEEFDAVVTSVSETFEKVRVAVTGAFERIKAAFSDAFGEYFTSGQAAQDITNLLTSAIELFGDAVSVAADFVATAVKKIIDFAKWLSEGSTGAGLFAAAVTGIVAAVTAYKVVSIALAAAQKGLAAAQALVNAVMSANPFVLVATLIAGVVAAVITLWNTNEDFRDAVKKIWEAIAGFFTGAWEAITGVWSAAAEWFAGIRDGIMEAFVNIGKRFGDKFAAAYNAVTSAWNGAGKWFGDRWADISGAFQSAEKWFSDTFSKAWNAVTDAFGGVKDFFGGVWDDITGVFTGAFDWFKGIGKNIIDGLTEGIGGLWSTFINFISGKTDEVKDEFEGEQGFDTHSPSKWSEKVFRNVLQGGEIGLERGLPGILSGAENAVRDIQSALSADPFRVSGGYQLSGGYSYAQAPQLAAAGAGYGGSAGGAQPLTLVLNNTNEVGGERYERRQRKFRVAEDARRGRSYVNL